MPTREATFVGRGSLLPLFLIIISLLVDLAQTRSKEEVFFIRWPLPTQGLLLAGFLLIVIYLSYFWGQPIEATFLYQSF